MTIDHDSGWREVTATEFAGVADRLAYRLQEVEEKNRRLQVRIEDMKIEHKRLRSELDRTKAELQLVTQERDTALLRLDELGSEV